LKRSASSPVPQRVRGMAIPSVRSRVRGREDQHNTNRRRQRCQAQQCDSALGQTMYFPLRKALLTGLWTAAALGAVIGPSLLAVDMVREYGLRQQREQAQVLAQRLLGRIGLTADRLLRIHRELVHTGGSSPCAPYSTNLMQQQVLRFPD